MRIFLAGGTGAIGRALVPALVSSGHFVVAMTRSPEGRDLVRRLGAEAVTCDVFDREALRRAVAEAAPEAVVHQLTAIPPRINPRRVARDLAPTGRLRTEGTRNLLEAARGARLFIAQSIAFAYAPAPAPRDETAPLHLGAPRAFRPVIESIRDLEAMVVARSGGIALRYGFFYGPGTVYAPGGSFHEDVMRRRIPVPGEASGVFSFVHVDDAAQATLRALEEARPGIYNVVDDDPAPLSEWLPAYARAIGARPPMKVPALLARIATGPYGDYLLQQQPGASNAKARREMGWSPGRESWRDGFAS